ncbi:MAG: methyltransferase [Eubacteriales bacterium]|nr:methyltransferase [Eubacteriales bacterium]
MYRFERLSDDIKIAVSDDHTFGTDAVILSHFAGIKPRDKALDMGTGCGIIPMLWLRNEKINNVSCLDIQENAYEQICFTIKENHLENRITPHLCDLREISKAFKAEQFSLVTMNPPYKPVGTGIESLSESAKIARHEICCSIEDAVKAAAYLLKYGGRFCMCHRPERLVDTLEIMRKYKLEPKRLRFVQDRNGEQPFLFLVQGQKGSKPFLRVEPQLIIKKENGKFTDEMLEIYGSYADGYDK